MTYDDNCDQCFGTGTVHELAPEGMQVFECDCDAADTEPAQRHAADLDAARKAAAAGDRLTTAQMGASLFDLYQRWNAAGRPASGVV